MAGSGRFFGDRPVATILWLVVLSVVVGFVFRTIGLNPLELIRGIITNFDSLIQALIDLGHWLVVNALSYFLVGVVVVVPLWLIARLVATRR